MRGKIIAVKRPNPSDDHFLMVIEGTEEVVYIDDEQLRFRVEPEATLLEVESGNLITLGCPVKFGSPIIIGTESAIKEFVTTIGFSLVPKHSKEEGYDPSRS